MAHRGQDAAYEPPVRDCLGQAQGVHEVPLFGGGGRPAPARLEGLETPDPLLYRQSFHLRYARG